MSEEKRDYVKEAYECFIKNAEGLDPTDPVKAVEAYFEKNATDELKARCKAEGKDAKKCWEFITPSSPWWALSTRLLWAARP